VAQHNDVSAVSHANSLLGVVVEAVLRGLIKHQVPDATTNMSTAGEGMEWLTATSVYSLGFVSAIGVVAYLSANAFLPKRATSMDRFTWIWLVGHCSLFMVILLSDIGNRRLTL
jgi:hypothetical protein